VGGDLAGGGVHADVQLEPASAQPAVFGGTPTPDGVEVVDPGAPQRAVSLQWFEVEPVARVGLACSIGCIYPARDNGLRAYDQ